MTFASEERLGLPDRNMRAMVRASYDARELRYTRATIAWAAPPPYYAGNDNRGP